MMSDVAYPSLNYDIHQLTGHVDDINEGFAREVWLHFIAVLSCLFGLFFRN